VLVWFPSGAERRDRKAPWRNLQLASIQAFPDKLAKRSPPHPDTPRFRTIQVCPKDLQAALRLG
jgi:hypothetical protein